jgi:outer membrane receptor protein involved in Fe transport
MQKLSIFRKKYYIPMLVQVFLLNGLMSESIAKGTEITKQQKSVLQTVSGIVTAEKGAGLSGVNIQIKGTSKGTTTDAQGKFKIDVPNENAVLVFSFIGYSTQEINVGSQTNINVTLKEDVATLDEVIVTGVFDKRTRMESSVAISVLNSKQLELQSPTSAADILKNIPGVFVNSASGEIKNAISSRGFYDAINGYYYVSMQEDGLPVTGASYSNYAPDYFLRPDITLGKLEAVRGGTASILGNNAPGGIFNYVSKTGGTSFSGEARAKYGLEGNGKNPYYRIDVNLSGPLSKDKSLTYNLGGFWRQNDGSRFAGYPMNNGGQLKANLVKTTQNSTIKLYVKYLDDKNTWLDFLPTVNFDKPTLAPGVDITTSYMAPPISVTYRLNQTNDLQTYDSRDKIHNKEASVGLNMDFNLGNGWSIDNKIRLSDKSSYWNATAVPFPVAVDNVTFFGLNGWVGAAGLKLGNYVFSDVATGNKLLSVNFGVGATGLKFTSNGSLPGESIQKNSLIFNPLTVFDNNVKEVVEQLTINKKVKNMNFTGGLFFVNSSVNRTSSAAGTAYTQMTEGYPRPTAITYTDLTGKVFQITNPDGVLGGSGRSNPASLFAINNTQLAYFLGHNWDITSKLNFDWGIRFESIRVKGTNQIGTTTNLTDGGTDKNPLTVYDNTAGIITSTYDYDKTVKTTSFSSGLNYSFNNNIAVFGRYSLGNKAPDLTVYMNVSTAGNSKFLNPIAQTTQQFEAGFKYKASNLSLYLTPFYSILGNVPVQSLGQETSDINSLYATPVLYNKVETKGIEIEGNYSFNKNLSLRAVATFQNSIAVNYNVWNLGGNGAADDKTVDFSGNENKNIPKTIIRLSPTYTFGNFLASLDWSYMGARQANIANAFVLPAYNQTNLNVRYAFNQKLSLQANVNNIFNQYAVMDWAAPGGFPAALNTDGFTKAQLEANPNAIYSTSALPPRAYFLTLNYKF